MTVHMITHEEYIYEIEGLKEDVFTAMNKLDEIDDDKGNVIYDLLSDVQWLLDQFIGSGIRFEEFNLFDKVECDKLHKALDDLKTNNFIYDDREYRSIINSIHEFIERLDYQVNFKAKGN